MAGSLWDRDWINVGSIGIDPSSSSFIIIIFIILFIIIFIFIFIFIFISSHYLTHLLISLSHHHRHHHHPHHHHHHHHQQQHHHHAGRTNHQIAVSIVSDECAIPAASKLSACPTQNHELMTASGWPTVGTTD